MFAALHSGRQRHDIQAKVMVISIVTFVIVFFVYTLFCWKWSQELISVCQTQINSRVYLY